MREREMIKKKLHSPESFRGRCLLRLRKGVGGVGELDAVPGQEPFVLIFFLFSFAEFL